MNDIGKIELVFLFLLLFIIVFGLIARRLATPYPIVMVIGGLLLGFVPGIPRIDLNPDLVFLVVLPPLLYAAAWTTSWRDFPGAGAAWLVRTRLLHQREKLPRRGQIFVLGWTGMRGVVSLAAALALPALLADGSPFPQRDLIVFLTFCVICVTLVLQGLTLPPLIRALGLAGAAGPNCEEREARRIVIDAALSHLNDAKEKDSEEAAALYEDLIRHYHQRLASLQSGDVNPGQVADHDRHLELSLEALRVERETAVRLRDEGRVNDDVLRQIERELDLSESRIATVREK